MFTFLTYCIVIISAVLFATVATLPVPPGSEIYQNFFQGDIKLSDYQKEILAGPRNGTRTGWTHPFFRWPKNTAGYVIVPYNIDEHQGFSEWWL